MTARRSSIRVAFAAGAAALTTAAATAAPPVHVVQGDRSMGGVRLGRTTAPAAAILFADDGARRIRRRPNSCLVTWPRIGLTIDFGTIGTDPTNPCTGGTAFAVTITSRAAWRTAVGLAVGDPATRLQRLYPRASRRQDASGPWRGYWLVTRRLCPTVGGGTYPALLARTRDGRVTALVASAGICD